jgi:hypothetical protein
VSDVTVERKRYAKAEPGKLADPASYAVGLAHSSGVFCPNCPPSARARPLGTRATAGGVRADPDGRPLGSPRRLDSLGRFARRHKGAGAAVTPPSHPPRQREGQRQPNSGREWNAHPAKGAHLP